MKKYRNLRISNVYIILFFCLLMPIDKFETSSCFYLIENEINIGLNKDIYYPGENITIYSSWKVYVGDKDDLENISICFLSENFNDLETTEEILQNSFKTINLEGNYNSETGLNTAVNKKITINSNSLLNSSRTRENSFIFLIFYSNDLINSQKKGIGKKINISKYTPSLLDACQNTYTQKIGEDFEFKNIVIAKENQKFKYNNSEKAKVKILNSNEEKIKIFQISLKENNLKFLISNETLNKVGKFNINVFLKESKYFKNLKIEFSILTKKINASIRICNESYTKIKYDEGFFKLKAIIVEFNNINNNSLILANKLKWQINSTKLQIQDLEKKGEILNIFIKYPEKPGKYELNISIISEYHFAEKIVIKFSIYKKNELNLYIGLIMVMFGLLGLAYKKKKQILIFLNKNKKINLKKIKMI